MQGYFLHLSNSGLESNAFNPSRLFFTSIEFGIECVEVFAVEFFLDDTECFTESLEMNNLTLSQEADRGGHFRIPDSPQYVVISGTRLLFGSQILSQVGNNIAFGLEFAGIERDSSGSLRHT